MRYTCVLLLLAASFLEAQDNGALRVLVVDSTSAIVPGAKVTLVNAERRFKLIASTDELGQATFDHLSPGEYSLQADKEGFDSFKIEKILLSIRERQNLRAQLKVKAAAQASVTVTAQAEGISADPAEGISVEQDFIRNLPLNGRSLDSLVSMTPGVTSAAGARGGGGFNANGLRSNMNYYTLDGVSVNSGNAGGPAAAMGGGGGPRGGGAGMAALMTLAGSGDVINLDALSEMRVQTSSFAPEFGRTPGAQISMVSRGGSNTVHGSVSDYFRNDRLDANDWFANSAGEQKGKLRQNRFAGSLGGPVIHDKTFFFASYEGLRLQSPTTVIASVPSLAVRKSARANLRPFLNAFPIANGPDLTGGAAQFRAVVSNPSDSDTASLRLDHSLSASSELFLRFSQTGSSGGGRGTDMITPNVVSDRNSKSQLLTGGYTRNLKAGAVNDVRVNYSNTNMRSNSFMDSFGGAVPLTDAQVFPNGVNSESGQFSLSVQGLASYSLGGWSHSAQKQVNVVDTYSKADGAHLYKLGIDYRYIAPTMYRKPYTASITFRSLGSATDSMLAGLATNGTVTSNVMEIYPRYINASFYAQDTFRVNERTTLTYGLRWDVNPAPTTRKGDKPFALDSSGSDITQDAPLYKTRYFDVAPRFGLAYQMDTAPGREMIFRSGVGLFYDMGYGMTGGAFGGAPYSAVRTLTSVAFPLAVANLSAPTLPPTTPYGQITAADKGLKSPKVVQYSASVERNFGIGQSLTVAYAGSRGSDLVRTEMQPSFSTNFDLLTLTTNGASSNYNGLQVSFRRRFSASLQTQVGYTYSHSIDSASSDIGMSGGFATLFGAGERGSSDYDIRHNLSWSGSWRTPLPQGGIIGYLTKDWYADWVVWGRTGLPFDVQGITTAASNASSTTARGGLFAQVRPDYNGKPVWVDDPNVPGGKRLNLAAFSAPSGYAQGNLGRNAIRGFSARQADLALRRQLSLTERWRMQLSAQAYNVFNTPSFANPSTFDAANLSSANFGVATRMLGSSFGGGNSLYRTGGARSVELSIRLQF